ncbi:DNA repair and recombination protein RAD54B-like [Topomyia yanbarensis]|uniref:DNA repair and recombination protein RAD54B-like n=1 Tax=Topomyia yanbarensis TaxID=2498891 RepID=UPI00273B9EB7|nr:DNA repair and recombination protein RAD54B-like [Topomyia yanbarensis]XP_058833752.1 DNA repair and recombination protein RAD54B-like [Topomyia yanbarensis]XP_058833753.1 DNA repair and recombination protein RAD54B-like [Topomyia yanbarensis]
MRRSCAPSMKRAADTGSEQTTRPFLSTTRLAPEKAEVDAKLMELFNSSENHARTLETLAKTRQPLAPRPVEEKQHCTKVLFSVVWGKITTKKHKTWEGDGTLELTGKCATLINEDGKIIASSNGVKTEDFEEGSRVIVGSKELEIIEKLSSVGDASNENLQQQIPSKRSKLETIDKHFKPPAVHNSIAVPSTSKRPVLDTAFKQVAMSENEVPAEFVPLLMGTPSYEHQWKHNNSKGSISEVSVPYCLAKHLRPHQREGVKFLYKCVIGFTLGESEWCGAILADEMGLGKTLQCISLVYTLLKQGPYGQPMVRRVLIVTPSSLVDNWKGEITKWLETERIFTFIVGPNNKLKKYAQSPHIPILIISYEMLAKQIEELESVKFDLVVCDEGHRLKNSNIRTSTVLDGIDCHRRILLTGTPIQNDLQEFYSLINFVNPGILGSYAEFKAKYEIPIIQSQQPNVLKEFQELGKLRLVELNSITSKFVLRRTQEVINKYLPKKQELVVFVYPSQLQQTLLRTALQSYEQSGPTVTSPLKLITILKKICNHPSLITVPDKNDPESLIQSLNDRLPAWNEMSPEDSGKLSILGNLLEALIVQREKIVVVSYYSKTLDMIMGLCQHYNYKFCRLDGSTPSNDRSKHVASFNSTSSDIFVFLLSAKAGGTGLNLIGASRLVLFDNDWNPASDLQAMARIWRDGQSRPVYIYRLITAFSIEEKIYQRQISKSSLSGAIVDQTQNLSNLKFSDEELKDLFSFVNESDDCLTHQLLACDCKGAGDIPEPLVHSSQEEHPDMQEQSRFQIRAAKSRTHQQRRSMKMQELMRWEHHRSPVRNDVLEELSLTECSEGIVFLFRNKS